MKRFVMFLSIFVAVLMLAGTYSMAGMEFEERHGAYSSGSGFYSTMTCTEEFQSMDANRDGILNDVEYKTSYDGASYAGTVPSPSGTPAFLAFGNKDRNNDSFLSQEEFCTG